MNKKFEKNIKQVSYQYGINYLECCKCCQNKNHDINIYF